MAASALRSPATSGARGRTRAGTDSTRAPIRCPHGCGGHRVGGRLSPRPSPRADPKHVAAPCAAARGHSAWRTAGVTAADCTVPFVLPAAAALAAAAYAGALPLGGGALRPLLQALLVGCGPLLLHGALPLLDALLGPRPPPPTAPGLQPPGPDDLAPRLLPAAAVLAHLAAALAACAAVAAAPLRPCLLPLLALSLAASGSAAQAAAHELLHGRHPLHAAAARLHLAAHWFYPYFRAHHQHHLTVCTPVDYTSAPRGLSFYRYLPQYVAGSYAEAWQLACEECAREGKPRLSLHNSTLVGCLAQAALSAAICAAFGPAALTVHLAAAATLLTYMAALDYSLHYGLVRPLLPGGRRHAPVTPYNSWSSPYPMENALLFNVLRHGDHHMAASRSYGWLRPAASAPLFPAPINLLALAAFVPPLWASLMDRRADEANQANMAHLGLSGGSAVLQPGVGGTADLRGGSAQ